MLWQQYGPGSFSGGSSFSLELFLGLSGHNMKELWKQFRAFEIPFYINNDDCGH